MPTFSKWKEEEGEKRQMHFGNETEKNLFWK